MPVWTWAVGPGASAATPGPVRQLTAAHGRVLTTRVAGHAYAQFSIDGRHDEANEIVEQASDLWVYRDGDLLFRGRLRPSNETIGSTHPCQFTAVDYRGMLSLAAKIVPPIPTFTNVDQAVIAWQLVQHAQAQTGGDWGITNGIGATSSVNRDEADIRAHQPVGEIIDRLAERENGFEWEIDENLVLNRWFPQRGSDNGVVLDYGGNVDTITITAGEFANALGVAGDNTTTPVTAEHASLASDERGRWMLAQAYPSVSLQSTISERAVWAVNRAVTIENILSLTMSAGRWGGRDELWIGDSVMVHVNSGRRQINSPHRVLEMLIAIGDNGVEAVTVSAVGVEPGAPAGLAPTDPLQALAQRITSIESRVADAERAS